MCDDSETLLGFHDVILSVRIYKKWYGLLFPFLLFPFFIRRELLNILVFVDFVHILKMGRCPFEFSGRPESEVKCILAKNVAIVVSVFHIAHKGRHPESGLHCQVRFSHPMDSPDCQKVGSLYRKKLKKTTSLSCGLSGIRAVIFSLDFLFLNDRILIVESACPKAEIPFRKQTKTNIVTDRRVVFILK